MKRIIRLLQLGSSILHVPERVMRGPLREDIYLVDADIIGLCRFQSKQQLHAVKTGFRSHESTTSSLGHKYFGDEILLYGLCRLKMIAIYIANVTHSGINDK
jgi:hypothetical protein